MNRTVNGSDYRCDRYTDGGYLSCQCEPGECYRMDDEPETWAKP